jgi:integrase
MEKRIIRVPKSRKRSNQIHFIDDELHAVLSEYLIWWCKHARLEWLWLSPRGCHMHKDVPNEIIREIAEPQGLHVHNGELWERCTSHCFRHFFTTELFRAGMNEQHIMFLRGDSLTAKAWQRYNHIELEDVRREYNACIPQILC